MKAADSSTRFPSAPSPVRSGPLGVVPPQVDLEATVPLGQTVRSSSELLAMRCLRCQGAVERGTAPVRIERNGYKLAWEAVPAWICKRCDLSYFEPQEVETIQKALQAMRTLPQGEA
ncbi:MAG TPA: YgiT-type zinc finger protein [Thermoanaerobaculia bacterium]